MRRLTLLLLLAFVALAQEPPAGTPERPGGVDMADPASVEAGVQEARRERDAIASDAPAAAERTATLNLRISTLENHLAFLERQRADLAAAAAATPEAIARKRQANFVLTAETDVAARKARARLEPIRELDPLRDTVRSEYHAPLAAARTAATEAATAHDGFEAAEASLARRQTDAQTALDRATETVAALRKREKSEGLTNEERNRLRTRIEVQQQVAAAARARIDHLGAFQARLPDVIALARLEKEAAELQLRAANSAHEAARALLEERLAALNRAAEAAIEKKRDELAAAKEPYRRRRLEEELTNVRLRLEVGALEREVVVFGEQVAKLRFDSAEAERTFEQYRSAYAGEAGAGAPPTESVVSAELRRLQGLADPVLFRTARDQLARDRDRFTEARTAVNARLDSYAGELAAAEAAAREEAGEAWSGEEASWQQVASERAELLGEKRATLDALVGHATTNYDLRADLHETRRRTLILLRRENLLLRGTSHISWDSLRRGLSDLVDLPGYLAGVVADTGRYLAAGERRGAVLFYCGGLLAAAFLLFFLRRIARRRGEEAAAAEDGQTLRTRAKVVLGKACGIAFLPSLLFLALFGAAFLLPGMPEGVAAFLRSTGVLLPSLLLALGVVRAFLQPGVEAAAGERGAARRLARGIRILIAVSLVFLPVRLALEYLGYTNRGVVELWALLFKAVFGCLLVLLILRRDLLLGLLPREDTPLKRVLNLLIVYLRPIAVLLVPTAILLDVLRYDILAGLIAGVSAVVFVVSLAGFLGYRFAFYLVQGWLRHEPDPEKDEEDEASIRRSHAAFVVSRFILRLAFFFVSAWAVLALSGTGLNEVRSFFEVPLPFQGEAPEDPVTWWNLFAALLILVFFLALVRAAKLALQELFLARTKLDPGLQYTIATLFGYVVVGVGIYLAIAEIFDLSKLGYMVAALTVGIGFGLQEIVANFSSGLTLLFERPLKVGDLVQVGETEGIVQKINIRATTVLTRDNVYILVPNKELIVQNVVNFTHTDSKVRVKIAVGVSYGSDVGHVRDVLLEVATTHGRVLKRPNPEVWLVGFGSSSVDFQVLVWVARPEDRHRISSDLYFAFWSALKRNNVEIPFPQRDVHLRASDPLRIIQEPPPKPDAEPKPEE